MRPWKIAVLAASVLVAGCDADFSGDRSAAASVDGFDSVRIVGDAGTIEVAGDAGRTTLNASGTAYATSAARLETIQFVVRPDGDVLVVEARAAGANSRFDIAIAIPGTLAVIVETGAGEAVLRDVRSARVRLGAGNVTIDGVGEDVRVESVGAGNVTIADVGGRVDVSNIGAGNVDITTVGGGVDVRDIGVGNITVRDVGGDLSVGNRGVGNVTHSDVRGAVNVR
ncbi:MAG: DUF4097 family beta strand repeat protein [Bauldia sp.]|nr:DUF4097 family beta strand repeat protein [Bauldia sp.]